jgi:hypothetical protein
LATSEPRADASGGVVFAFTLLAIAGVLNMIWALVAISQDDYFRVDELIFGDLTAWGAAYMTIGVLQLVAAFLIAMREPAGQVMGIFLAAFAGINALLSIGAYPIWGVTIMVVCGFIIWALGRDEAFFGR